MRHEQLALQSVGLDTFRGWSSGRCAAFYRVCRAMLAAKGWTRDDYDFFVDHMTRRQTATSSTMIEQFCNADERFPFTVAQAWASAIASSVRGAYGVR